jgi:hypothetical protein
MNTQRRAPCFNAPAAVTRRQALCWCTAALSGLGSAAASAQQEAAAPPGGRVLGERLPGPVVQLLPPVVATRPQRFRFWGFEVYDTVLWHGAGFEGSHFARHPFALELRYLRSLKGPAIAERSLAEMQRLDRLTPVQADRWLQWMQAAFPDVNNGQRIIGVHRPGQGAAFWTGASLPLAELDDARFAELFFGIWLSPHTSQPALRRALLESTGQGGAL